ncbi:MAG: hypothetical protein RLZZ476_199 [Verrucomicrobiota bacterium]|jgi:uncharacterized protein (DUF1800 family)
MQPSPTYIALNRATFGPTAEEIARVESIGWSAWVEEQLKPDAAAKDDAVKRIAAHKLEIEYEHEGMMAPAMMMKAEKPAMMAAAAPDGKKPEKQKFKVKEKRGLTSLDKPLEQLFRVQRQDDYPYQEVERCSFEVEVATLIRACYSKWQVKELLVDFWHNHFNVNIDADDTIRAVWPAYDRDVIRKHALGNFRELLQAVAQGLPMLYYLNNRSSKASPANENYARELFELHTLGAEHYLNHLHKKWREVPGALEGKAAGFIDQDVYEAARAFTGWTAADGEYDDDQRFPETGGFHYHAPWHDPYQKRVLGVELEANQPPLADGMAVLDLAAFHPGTAIYLSRKLCRRFIADEPNEDLVKRVAKVWSEHAKSPDQIAHVMREILLSPEMQGGFGQKTKRPLEYLCGFIRATGADVRPDGDIVWRLGECGQRLFQWGAPTGHPDTADYWQSPNSLLKRWQLARDLATGGFDGEVVRMNLLRSTPPDKKTWQEVAEHWLDRLAPGLLDPNTRDELITWFREYDDDGKPRHHEADAEITLDESDLADHLGELVALVAATPEYQLR